MSDRHDDEITHYRARVDQIPERPEVTPERAAMSEERLAEIRAEADRVFRNQADPLTRGVYQLMAEIERLEAVIAERDATIRVLLPLAESWYHHECEYGGYDPINGDWATEQHQRDERAISQAKALAGEAAGTRGGGRMIDTADLERWATMDTYKGVYLTMEGLSGLARDYLAMRAIVEALAASDPIILDNGRFTCCHCGAQTVARYDVNGHKQDCRWREARALIGPASERTEG